MASWLGQQPLEMETEEDERFCAFGCCAVLIRLLLWLSGKRPLRQNSMGVQTTQYEAPPSDSAGGTSSTSAQHEQADSSTRGNERNSLLPKGGNSSDVQSSAASPTRVPEWTDSRSTALTSVVKGQSLSRATSKSNLKEGLEWGVADEDACPTCLEPYTTDNPSITTKCNHSFHLACIYEWLERSQTCPFCSRKMEFEEIEQL